MRRRNSIHCINPNRGDINTQILAWFCHLGKHTADLSFIFTLQRYDEMKIFYSLFEFLEYYSIVIVF